MVSSSLHPLSRKKFQTLCISIKKNVRAKISPFGALHAVHAAEMMQNTNDDSELGVKSQFTALCLLKAEISHTV